MSEEITLAEAKKAWHGSYRSYVVGFLSSLILTLISFSLVVYRPLDPITSIFSIVILALIQGSLQLWFFLHVGQEDAPKWETMTFYSMLGVLLIISIGSLWIMNDLNARMMPDMPMDIHHG
ncbi:MAG: cytochrome o ubiquinol oxidase subunit IV [Parachlamydiaceae bacterium]